MELRLHHFSLLLLIKDDFSKGFFSAARVWMKPTLLVVVVSIG
jgi:hypothetical protein